MVPCRLLFRDFALGGCSLAVPPLGCQAKAMQASRAGTGVFFHFAKMTFRSLLLFRPRLRFPLRRALWWTTNKQLLWKAIAGMHCGLALTCGMPGDINSGVKSTIVRALCMAETGGFVLRSW